MLVLFRAASPLAVAPRRAAATSLRSQAHCTVSIRDAAAKLLRRNAGIAELFSLPSSSSSASTSASTTSSSSSSSFHSSTIVCGRRSAKIATRKGAQDLKKAKLYGKLGKLILASARQGGTDPVANPKLRDALSAAKAAALPKEIIDRNIKKAGEKAGGADFAEVLYECYGPGGKTGFIVEALTDNVNRTAAEVKTAIKSGGGKVADGGSVKFGFERSGVVVLDPEAAVAGEGGSSKSLDEDTVLEAAAEAGADDAVPSGSGGRWRVVSAVEQFGAVRDALAAAGLPVAADASGLEWLPKTPVELEAEEDLDANERLYQKLLEVDDVDAVFCSCPLVGGADDEDEDE